MMTEAQRKHVADELKRWAIELGFADAGVARLSLAEDSARLKAWLEQGFNGSMNYMSRNQSLRENPAELHAGTASVISIRMNYWPEAEAPWAILKDRTRAYVSRYALGRDYHKLLRSRLSKLAKRLESVVGPHGYRVFADSAPVLEKALARNAKLGWIGKNTLLIEKNAGSYFFIGELFTDLALPADPRPQPEDLCGRCQACIRSCPTGAIVAPGKLDARRCISYLTIENRGTIPEPFRRKIGNRIFGCDDCQLVCPWNQKAQTSRETDFRPRFSLDKASLLELWQWDEATWMKRTEGMPIRRLKYRQWLRNLAVALGNAEPSSEVRQALSKRAQDEDTLVREHVAWALAVQSERPSSGRPLDASQQSEM